MAESHFSGPLVVNGGNGGVDVTAGGPILKCTAILTAALPAAAAGNAGHVYLISDNGVGDNETALVVSTGSAWVTADGNALD